MVGEARVGHVLPRALEEAVGVPVATRGAPDQQCTEGKVKVRGVGVHHVRPWGVHALAKVLAAVDGAAQVGEPQHGRRRRGLRVVAAQVLLARHVPVRRCEEV